MVQALPIFFINFKIALPIEAGDSATDIPASLIALIFSEAEIFYIMQNPEDITFIAGRSKVK